MPNRARVALTVLDLETSIAFYTTLLNFELVESQPDVGLAYIRDSDGDMLLLALLHQTDLRSLLDEPAFSSSLVTPLTSSLTHLKCSMPDWSRMDSPICVSRKMSVASANCW